MNEKVHHFGVCGMVNGLAVMSDEETHSYWDHISGEAFEGPLQGYKLDVWPIALTTVEAAIDKHPELMLIQSTYRSWGKSLLQWLNPRKINARSYLLPPFRRTMSKPVDSRLPEMEQGLGVIVDSKAKYYPMKAIAKGKSIEDNWDGRILRIERGAIDGVPFARWSDTGEVPMQLLTRWYGFSYTYPDCEIL